MTGRTAYNRALALINERDSRGESHEDTLDYEKNAPELLNLVISSLWADDCIVRGIPPRDWRYTLERIETLDEELSLHEAVCALVPYLMASMLIHEEDMERAEYYRKLFLDAESTLVSSFARASHTGIVDVYSREGF